MDLELERVAEARSLWVLNVKMGNFKLDSEGNGEPWKVPEWRGNTELLFGRLVQRTNWKEEATLQAFGTDGNDAA